MTPTPHNLVDRLWIHIRRQLGVNQTLALLREIRDEQRRAAAAMEPSGDREQPAPEREAH